MAKRPDEQRLVWLDLEMTGLDPQAHQILELAAVVTDSQLQVIAEGPTIVVHHEEQAFTNLLPIVQAMHQGSGLLTDVLASDTSCTQAEETMLAFVSAWCQPRTALLCGNTIYQDRSFLKLHMPRLEAFFHYRVIDVSSIKEMIRRWYPHDERAWFKKPEVHRALPDVYASIEELRHYRRYFFVGHERK
jgi:oligoribonuclease